VSKDTPLMGLFYAVATTKAEKEAPEQGVIWGKVGCLKLKGDMELELYRRLNALGSHWKELHYITMQVLPLAKAQVKEHLTLLGLRAALKCSHGSESFELPYSVGTEWEKGKEITTAILADFEAVGRGLPERSLHWSVVTVTL
jgi:hypothetical protein